MIRRIYVLSGYREPHGWCWRHCEPIEVRAGNVFRVKLGETIESEDFRDRYGNTVFLATAHPCMRLEGHEVSWHVDSRPASDNDMRRAVGRPERMAECRASGAPTA